MLTVTVWKRRLRRRIFGVPAAQPDVRLTPIIEASSIRVLTVIILTMAAGCRELPPARSSADSQTSIVKTTSSPDSETSIVATTSSPSLGAAPIAGADTAPSVQLSSRKDSLCGDLAENGFGIPNTRRKAVAAQLGRPDSVRSQPAPNTHNPAQMDTVVDMFYPGLRLHYAVLGVTEGETDILLEADVSDNRYLKYPALGVGASVGVIVSALGQPEERTNDTYSYSCALHVMSGSTVYFHFDGDRVKFVVYRWDAD